MEEYEEILVGAISAIPQLLFPAERTLVEIKLNQLVAFVQLYRALGGGF